MSSTIDSPISELPIDNEQHYFIWKSWLVLCDQICSQVAGVVGRAELLSAIFFMLTIFAYQRATKSKQGV